LKTPGIHLSLPQSPFPSAAHIDTALSAHNFIHFFCRNSSPHITFAILIRMIMVGEVEKDNNNNSATTFKVQGLHGCWQ
jgi:hypothetical protein